MDANSSCHAGILARITEPPGRSPQLIGWDDGFIKVAIAYSVYKPVHSLIAGIILCRTLGCEIAVFLYEAHRNVTPHLSPLEDPLGFTAIHAVAWSDGPTVGWLSKLHRTDDGKPWWDEPEPFDDIPPSLETAAREGMRTEIEQDAVLNWMEQVGHTVSIL
jgi:hypothetical protein